MEKYLSPAEAAERLGISRPYLYNLINNGTLAAIRDIPKDSIKVRGPLRIKESDVDQLLKKERNVRVA